MNSRFSASKQTPMLTLNQKLEGEQTDFKPTIQTRVYRQGEKPAWIKETQKKLAAPREGGEGPPRISASSQPKIVRPAETSHSRRLDESRPIGRKGGRAGSEAASSTSEDEEDAALDLAALDLGHLKVVEIPDAPSDRKDRYAKSAQPPKSSDDTAEKPNRRATLKKYLLKSQEARLAIDEASSTSSAGRFRRPLGATPGAGGDEAGEASSGSSSDGEGDGDEADGGGAVSAMQKRLFSEKPKFIGRAARAAEATGAPSAAVKADGPPSVPSAAKEEQNRLALQLAAVSEADAAAQLARHRADSLHLVVALSREEKRREAAERQAQMAALPDDGDDSDAEAAFERWKLRELERLKAESARRTRLEAERVEALQRRAMDEPAREEDNRRCGSTRYEKSAEKIQYLQKYFHKGAFFQDDAELVDKRLLRRNFLAPVGEDRYTDRTMLPKVMQVKDFGMASRTKYTHLVDQDTTFGDREFVPHAANAPPVMGDFENPVNPWMDFRAAAHRRFRRVAGAEGFERPAKRKKVDDAP